MNISDRRPITVSLLVAAVFATCVAQASPTDLQKKNKPRKFHSSLNQKAAHENIWHNPFLKDEITAVDPGHRGDPEVNTSPVLPLEGLTATQEALFEEGLDDFSESDDIDEGLGPTLNFNSCGGCHQHPSLGGTSPLVNPQVAFALDSGNSVPSFITPDGPVREARFIRNPDGSLDGGVHSLFTIAGLDDAEGCDLEQEDFETQVANYNVIFRTPTPLFGGGLIEAITDNAILANQAEQATAKKAYGIVGRPNLVLTGHAVTGETNNNGNDGTIARFGWKAQNKSLLLFSGEAYNVEMGITNELFQTERNETATCQFAKVPNNVTDTDTVPPPTVVEGISAIEKFAFFMRFLPPPTPSTDTPGGADSINAGKAKFEKIGCALCHTPMLMTGDSAIAPLDKKPVYLYSDLLLHDMGPGLADGIHQGQAGPSEFRTAPLWGLGQRIFLLHDGRTRDLVKAIEAHDSGNSEAKKVIKNFRRLPTEEQQHVLNFLRSL